MQIKLTNKPKWSEFGVILFAVVLFFLIIYCFNYFDFKQFTVPMWLGWLVLIAGTFIGVIHAFFEIKY